MTDIVVVLVNRDAVVDGGSYANALRQVRGHTTSRLQCKFCRGRRPVTHTGDRAVSHDRLGLLEPVHGNTREHLAERHESSRLVEEASPA